MVLFLSSLVSSHFCNATFYRRVAMILQQSMTHHHRQWQSLHRFNISNQLVRVRHQSSTTSCRKRHKLLRTQISSNERTTQYTINESVCPPSNSTVLKSIVQKHIETLPKYLNSKPIAEYNIDAFEEALAFVSYKKQTLADDEKVKVVLDSGCGTGKSTRILGDMFPDCLVIGIDRSLVRLNKNSDYRYKHDTDSAIKQKEEISADEKASTNVLLLRADLIDFWHQCYFSSSWKNTVQIHKHYVLYPNPYPKKSRLKNRFYAHPAFPLLMLSTMSEDGLYHTNDTQLIIRSNWKGYLEEFALAVKVWDEAELPFDYAQSVDRLGKHASYKYALQGPDRIDSDNGMPMTNFEAKYFACGEPVYELNIQLIDA